MQKCIEYCKNHSKKKLDLFSKTLIKYEYYYQKKYKNSYLIHFLVKNSIFFGEVLIIF